MTPRRQILKWIPLTGLAALSRWSVAQDSAKPVSEGEPQAQALGYVADATRADKARFPKYAPPQHCATCQLFGAPATVANGPCTLFAGRSVASAGWCSAYVAKTG
jgi:hypothetical protein